MFDKMKEMAGQYQMMQKLMQNDEFKTFISHPKVQGLFMDPEFQLTAQSKDFTKIMAHPKVMELMKDPELAPLMAKLDPNGILNK